MDDTEEDVQSANLFSPRTKVMIRTHSAEIPTLAISPEPSSAETEEVQSLAESVFTLELKSVTSGRSSRQSLQLSRQSSLQSLRLSRQSLHSSIQSLHLSRQSLQLSAQSLNSIHSVETNDVADNDQKLDEDKIIKAQKLRRTDKILCKVQYATYSVLAIASAFVVMIIWYTTKEEVNGPVTIQNGTNLMAISNKSCPFWEIAGDGYCDDEANIAECGYDYKDCCEMSNDRLLCEDCFCFLTDEEKDEIIEKHEERCAKELDQIGLGDDDCDLNKNNKEHFFDVGDCCLEAFSCRFDFNHNATIVQTYCPENPCIKSNNFCIQEELGNGICEDYNNGPYCDYDLGDCCSHKIHLSGPTSTPKSEIACCQCSCKVMQPIVLG